MNYQNLVSVLSVLSVLPVPCPAGLVSGWVTKNIYSFVKQKHWTENTINANNCELSKVQILLACFMQKQILMQK